MIGQAILREIVGADLLRAITGFDHAAALVALGVVLLMLLDVEQPALQDLHRLGAVLQLAALVLTFDDDAARHVRDLHRAIGSVHALSARAARGRDVDLEIALVDRELDVFGIVQDGDGRRRSVNAALRLGRAYALHSMDAALVLQTRVDAVARDQGDELLQPARLGLARAQDFEAPAPALGVTRVHAKQVSREQRRLLAAGPTADFQDRILVVVRIAGEQQHPDLLFDAAFLELELLDLFSRERAQLWVVERLAIFGNAALDTVEAS